LLSQKIARYAYIMQSILCPNHALLLNAMLIGFP